MKSRNTIGWAALAAVIVTGACAQRETAPPAATEKVQAAADARLKAMSATLAAAQAFSFSTSDRRERVNAKGEKTARESTNEYLVARPDRFWQKRTREGVAALAVYDGSTLSLQGDGEKVWAQVEMPASLDEALDYVAEVYRLPMPIADLMYSDPYASIAGEGFGEETSVRLAGKEEIGGTQCDHLVIETPVIDAELWLEAGERALPCKLELVNKQAEGAPRTSIVFSDWNLSPQVDATRFAFTPPADYNRIRMVATMSEQEEALARAAQPKTEAATAEPAPSSGS